MRSTPRTLVASVREALDRELASMPKRFCYSVKRSRRLGDIAQVIVDYSELESQRLDESLEGAAAWWPGKIGLADILCVSPDKDEINLRHVNEPAPHAGEELFIYPPGYLQRLRDWWSDEENAFEAVEWLDRTRRQNEFNPDECAPQRDDRRFRIAQREAFWLTGWDFSLLEGPPGTGKTFTVGAIIAAYLAADKRRRVLLLSSTNTAVDLALRATDTALAEHGAGAWDIRRACKRVGQNFTGSLYAGREHLLPAPEPDLVIELTRLESRRPDSRDVAAYAQWKNEVEAVRRRFRPQAGELIRSCRLAAMTACAAVYWMDFLRSRPVFDLVVFDEASQLSLPYAIALAPLARRALFAGDPAQLAPIVRSTATEAEQWLGKTGFDIPSQAGRNTVFLNEQSRMHPRISAVVSETFYGGRLRVASDAERSPAWHEERTLRSGSRALRQNVAVMRVRGRSNYSVKHRGPTRLESAQKIARVVDVLRAIEKHSAILILTPFRAQRALIRELIGSRAKVDVSTVHKAQGSESHTVIFDPVDANHFSLMRPDAARLVNVAISRAKARLILLLSEADERNPLMSQIVKMAN